MDIEVSARTLREVEFREKLRGYNQDDVDEFLERAAAGVELLHDRLRQAMERAMRAEQRASDLPDDDDALRRTLVLAQRTADMAVKESQQQARETLANAQSEARSMVDGVGRNRSSNALSASGPAFLTKARISFIASPFHKSETRM